MCTPVMRAAAHVPHILVRQLRRKTRIKFVHAWEEAANLIESHRPLVDRTPSVSGRHDECLAAARSRTWWFSGAAASPCEHTAARLHGADAKCGIVEALIPYWPRRGCLLKHGAAAFCLVLPSTHRGTRRECTVCIEHTTTPLHGTDEKRDKQGLRSQTSDQVRAALGDGPQTSGGSYHQIGHRHATTRTQRV